MVPSPSWLAVGSLTAGLVSLGFVWFLWPTRDRLGGWFFIATICCEALWAFSYGVALLVFDPALRVLFEVPIWLGINFIGVCFLAFALAYTGRSALVRSKYVLGLAGVQAVQTLVVATNPLHHVAWHGYEVTPAYGAATVTYAHQPWLFLNAGVVVLTIAMASFLLVETVLSYGPLYRTQAAAIAISPVVPGLPFLLWLGQVGASPPLNLAPLLFPLHLAFDAYAFFSRDMFELVPAARRVADRAAIDNLGTAVVIVDASGRVIEFNDEARRVLDLHPTAALGTPLEDVLDGAVDGADDSTVTRVVDGRRRVYVVATAPLEDGTGERVGESIVLQDVTDERRREQRLSVLNRVLRHNIRNDLNVVDGYVDLAAERVDDESVRDLLGRAETKTADLLSLSRKARDVEAVVDADGASSEPVSVRDAIATVVDDLSTAHPTATIDVDATDATVRADRALLERVLLELGENALEHGGQDAPRLAVAATANAAAVTVTLRDDGPGAPAHELAVLEADTETALEHGSGIGLWLVRWGVDSLGASVAVDADETGTTATLRLPRDGAATGGSSP